MDARAAGRVLRPVVVIEDIADYLRDRAHDLPATGRAAHQERIVGAKDDRRRTRPEHPFARRDRVGLARPRIEPVHAIGDHDARAASHDPRSEPTAERSRERDAHPIAIHNIEMCGVGVIGHRRQAFAERGAERRCDEVQALGRPLWMGAEILAVQELKSPRDGGSTAQPRHRDHAVPAELHLHHGHDTSASLRAKIFHDRGPDLAVVHRARAIACENLERPRELRLAHALRRLEPGLRAIGRAVPEVHALRFGAPMEARRVGAKDERGVPVHDESVTRQSDRRLEESRPRQLAHSPVRELVGGERSRDAHGERAFDVGLSLDRGPSVHARPRVASSQLEHRLACTERRASRPIERRDAALPPDDKTGDPAEAAADR